MRDANNNLTTRLLLAGTGHNGSEALVTWEYHSDTGVVQRKYDVFGDLRVLQNEVNAEQQFAYDGMGRLIEHRHAIRPSDSNTNGPVYQLIDYYVNDGLGRRIQHWNNQLGSGVMERTDYDVQGRVISTIDMGGDTTLTSYVWNGSMAPRAWG